MKQLFRMISALVIGATLTSCNPLKANAKDAILGHWVSPIWSYAKKPVYVDFTSDGEMEYLYGGSVMQAKWLILEETGELKVTFHSGSSRRCKFALEGTTLTILTPTCLLWDDLGPSVALEKK